MLCKLANFYAETTKVMKKCRPVYAKTVSVSQLLHVITPSSSAILKWLKWLGWMSPGVSTKTPMNLVLCIVVLLIK